MHISFVVPTHRRPDALRQTLEALVLLDHPSDDYEVIVVDDGSGDSTPAVVGEFTGRGPAVRYLAQQNSGVATARNAGADAARGALLIFLDDDILVAADHITRQLAVRQEYGDCMVNGHWEFSPATRAALDETPFGRFRIGVEDWVKGGNVKTPLPDGRLRPTEVTAANLGVSAQRFRALGGFDRTFPFAGCEDQEFAYRARESGCTFVYDPDIRLLHNDQRVTLRQFCERQRRGAITSVHLAARHPTAYASRAILLENGPLSRYDPWPWRLKKMAKAVFASRAGLRTADLVTRQLERRAPESRILRRLYWITIGAYIFQGIREGLAQLPEARDAVIDAMRERFASA